ncbi:hypothetical protein TYRP_001507 [Tyrophagus putrescentiae]|nr:hypothetical protein TYRP_001507 [Tyrophagus putrescentiae]
MFILLVYLFGNQEKHHLILEKVEKTMEQVGIKMPKFEKTTSVSEKQDDVWSGNFSGFYRAVDGGGHYQKVSREDGNLYNDLVRDLAFREDTLRISSEESKDEDDKTSIYYTVVATSSTREKVHTERYRFTSGQPFHYLNEEDNLQAVINIAEDQWWQMVVGANVAIGRRFTDHQMTAMWKAGEALYVRNYKREAI